MSKERAEEFLSLIAEKVKEIQAINKEYADVAGRFGAVSVDAFQGKVHLGGGDCNFEETLNLTRAYSPVNDGEWIFTNFEWNDVTFWHH